MIPNQTVAGRVVDENKIAAIILDPLMYPLENRDEMLRGAREFCDDIGAILIFDEVISGFRLAYGGAGELYGVRPDLACFGKAIANGVPLACVTGKRDYMSRIGDAFISYTYGGDSIGLSACSAVMHEYIENDVIKRLREIHWMLDQSFHHLASKRLSINADGVRHTFKWLNKDGTEDIYSRSLFIQELVARGILTNGQFVPMYAHTNRMVGDCMDMVSWVAGYVKQFESPESFKGVLRGELIQSKSVRT
jgi:glutamate-1-semialdehyde aminotransferase